MILAISFTALPAATLAVPPVFNLVVPLATVSVCSPAASFTLSEPVTKLVTSTFLLATSRFTVSTTVISVEVRATLPPFTPLIAIVASAPPST